VRRDADVDALPERLLERRQEGALHRLEPLPRHRSRLDVDPLAEPDVRPFGRQRLDVGERPPHVGLEDDPEVVVLLPQGAEDGEGVVDRGVVFHVDPHEVPVLGGTGRDLVEVALEQLPVDLQAERGRLDRDVRVEFPLRDLLEHPLVLAHVRLGLGRVVDLLAEQIHRRHGALGVEPGNLAQRILDPLAGHVPGGDTADDELRDERHREDDQLVKQRHRLLPESGAPAPRSDGLRYGAGHGSAGAPLLSVADGAPRAPATAKGTRPSRPGQGPTRRARTNGKGRAN